jgi:hypothetical protein
LLGQRRSGVSTDRFNVRAAFHGKLSGYVLVLVFGNTLSTSATHTTPPTVTCTASPDNASVLCGND